MIFDRENPNITLFQILGYSGLMKDRLLQKTINSPEKSLNLQKKKLSLIIEFSHNIDIIHNLLEIVYPVFGRFFFYKENIHFQILGQ